jgi:hypothetical protein
MEISHKHNLTGKYELKVSKYDPTEPEIHYSGIKTEKLSKMSRNTPSY